VLANVCEVESGIFFDVKDVIGLRGVDGGHAGGLAIDGDVWGHL
jgi:hypothetical protein